MVIRVGSGVGVPSKERVQPVRTTRQQRPSRVIIVFFIISPFEPIDCITALYADKPDDQAISYFRTSMSRWDGGQVTLSKHVVTDP